MNSLTSPQSSWQTFFQSFSVGRFCYRMECDSVHADNGDMETKQTAIQKTCKTPPFTAGIKENLNSVPTVGRQLQ